ncbi:Germinal-center associated nuclear protein [Trichinella spiralis]|uniref:Germinal-center associated nuclear protein n=1 Tax=Trichinella spiralis TaxID=6334 RepID=A0A0V1B425_TRISP|nr:Germinal-center associated nuclear protein [Trichinella spiralis]
MHDYRNFSRSLKQCDALTLARDVLLYEDAGVLLCLTSVDSEHMTTGRDPIQISTVHTMQYFFVNLFCSLMSATVHNAMQFLSNFTFWHFHFMHYAFTFLGMLVLALVGRIPRQVLPWRQMLPIALSRLFSSIGINTVASGHLEGGLFILRGFDCCITGFVLLVCNRMLGSRLKRTRHRYYIVIPIAILSSLSWFYPTYWYVHFRWILFIPMAVIAGGFHNILSYNQYQKLGVPFSVFLMNISAYSAALLFIPIVVNKIFCFDCALESENDGMEFQLADYALLFGGMAAMFGLIFTQYMLMCHCNPIDYLVFRHFKYTLAAVGQQVTQNLMHYNFVNIFAHIPVGSCTDTFTQNHPSPYFRCLCQSGIMDGVQNRNKRFSLFKNVGHPVPINVKIRRKTVRKLANMRHFVGFSFMDRYKILESRDFNLRQGIIKENNAKEAKQVVGFCFEMCPEKERYRRLYQSVVPIYEMGKFWQNDADDNVDHVHMVKEYVRSSADQPEPLPHELRPPHILSLTMGYLIQNIVVREPHIKKHLSSWYYFLTNRMHAIRKDITQQMLCDTTTASILEKCVRFYIYGTYRLRCLPRSLFDQQLNLNELGHCLASLLMMYQDLKKCRETSPNQLEFFVYNMIYRMNDADMLGLVCRYDENLSDNPRVSFILQLHKYFQQGNYVQFFKAYKESATFLEACLLSRFVMEFRISSVNAIRRAHRMHRTTVKISSVTDWLCFDSDKEAEAFLAHFGVIPYPDQPDMVNFNPKDFQPMPNSLKTWWPKLNFVKTKLTKALAEIVNGGPIKSEAVLPVPCDSFDNYSRYTRDPVLDIYFGKKVVTYEQLHGRAPREQLSVHQSSSVDAMQYDDEEDEPPLPAFFKNICFIYEKDIPRRVAPMKESRSCFLGAAADLKFRRNSFPFGRAKARGLQYKRSSYVPQVKYPSAQHMHQRRGTLNNVRRGRAGLCRSNMANRGNIRPPYRGSNYRRNVSDRYHYFKSPTRTRAQPCLTYRMSRSGLRGTNSYQRGALKETKRPMGLEVQENLLNNQQTYLAKNTLQNDVNNLKTVCTDNFLVKQKLQTEHVQQETVQYANAATTFGGQVFEKPLPTAAPANISVPQIGSSRFNVENLEQNVEGIKFETNRGIVFPATATFNAAAETESAEKQILSEAAIVDGTSGNDAQAMEQDCLVESFAEECKQIQPAELGITSEIFSTQVTTPSTAVTSSSNFASWIGFPVVSVQEETLGMSSQAEQTITNSGTSFPTGGLFNVAASDATLPFNAASAFVQTTEANSSTPWLNFSFANVTKRQEEAKEKEFQAEKGTSLTWGSLFDENFGTESKMKEQEQQLFTISTTQGAELATAVDTSVPLTDFSSEAKRNETTDNSGKFGQEEKNIFFPVVSLSNYCEQMEPVASEVTAVTETVLPAVAAPAVSWSGFLSSSVTTQQEEAQEMDLEAHKGTLFPGGQFANVQNFQMQPLEFAPSAISFPNMATNTYASFANFSQSTTNSEVAANGPELQKGAFFSFGSHVVDEQKPLLFESFTPQIPETPTSTVVNLQSSWIDLLKNFERKTESPMEAEMIDLTGSDSSQQISEMAMPAVVEPAAPLDQPLPDEVEMLTDGSIEAQVEEEEAQVEEEEVEVEVEVEEEEEEVAQPMIETADSVVLERDVNAAPTNQETCIANWQTTTDSTEAPEQTSEQTSCPFSTELAAEMPSIVVPSIVFETTATETAYEPLRKQMKIVSADFAQHQSSPGRQLDDHHSAVADAAGILPSDHSLNLSDIFAQDHELSRRSFDVSSEMLETESSMQRKMRCVGAYRRIRDLFLAKELMEIAVDNLISRTVDQVVSELCEETIGALKQMIICRCLADILNCSYLRNAVRKICHQVILEEQKKMEEISKNSKTKTIQLMRKYFEIWYSITKTSRARKYFAALPLFDSVETSQISRGRRSTSLLSLIDTGEDEASDGRSSCSDDTVMETKLNSNVLESWHALDWPGLIRKWAAGSSGYKVSVNLKTRIRLLRCGLFVDPTLAATTREWIRLQFGLLAVRSKTWTLPPSDGNLDLLCLKNTLIREDAPMSVIKHLDWLMIAWNASASLAENHTIDISELCSTTRYLGLLVFVRLAKSDHYSESEIAKMLKLDVLVSTGCIAKYVVIMWPYENGNVNFRSLNFRPIGQYICHYFSERYDKILWKCLKSMTRDEANEMHKDAVADIRCSAQVVDPREYVEEEFLKLLGYPMSCFCSPDDFYKLLDEIGAINLPSQSDSSNSMSITEAVQYFFTSITDRILVIRCTNFIYEFAAWIIVKKERSYVKNMPFIGKDWRSYGDTWVPTRGGWEKKKLIPGRQISKTESSLERFLRVRSSLKINDEDQKVDALELVPQPHYFVPLHKSREFIGCISFGEAFLKLDIAGSVADVNRFEYTIKVLQILANEKLHSLSASARKAVFQVLEALVVHCLKEFKEPMTVRTLITCFIDNLNSGHHYGSAQLLETHRESLMFMDTVLKQFDFKCKESTTNERNIHLFDLPVDCLMEILETISDHQSLINLCLAHQMFSAILDYTEKPWEKLCRFYFKKWQMELVFDKLNFDPCAIDPGNAEYRKQNFASGAKLKVSWRTAYFELKKFFGLMEVYADMIHVCCYCQVLFWKSLGHPCLSENPTCVRVTPKHMIYTSTLLGSAQAKVKIN